MRNIAQFHKATGIHFPCTKRTVVSIQFIFQRGFVGHIHIKITNTALISSGKNHAQLIGSHTGNIPAAGNAISQPSGILVDKQVTAYVIRIILGIGQCPHLRKIPLTSPCRISIIKVMFGFSIFQRNLSNRTIVTGISSIHIACQSSSQQSMIKTRIKLYFIFFYRSFHFYSTQVTLPLFRGSRLCLIKGKRSSLFLQIQSRIGNRCVRKTHFSSDSFLLRCLEGKINTRSSSGNMRISRLNCFA